MIIEKLKDLEKESLGRGIPIIASEKGDWLYERVKEIKPKKILEVGTANGYSGIILGSLGGELITIEIDRKIAEEAKENFKKFKINAKIVIGDGVREVKKLAGSNNPIFDLIFIDFAKKKYIKVLDNCIKLVKKNGIIIADNIAMKNCSDFKAAIIKNKRLKTEIINIKDELSYSIKL